MTMLREANPLLVTIGTTVGASTEIDMARFAGGSFQIPVGSGTTAVTFYVQVGSGAYAIANDEDGALLPAMTVGVGNPYPFPSTLYSYPRSKIVASAGTATANVPVFLKS